MNLSRVKCSATLCLVIPTTLGVFFCWESRIQKIEPSSIPLKIVAAKLHFTDNNLAASIYLDTQTQHRPKKKKKSPERKYQLQSFRIGLLLGTTYISMHALQRPQQNQMQHMFIFRLYPVAWEILNQLSCIIYQTLFSYQQYSIVAQN